jgi:hypothetical protein
VSQFDPPFYGLFLERAEADEILDRTNKGGTMLQAITHSLPTTS